MNRYLRRATIGILAGILAGTALAFTLGSPVLGVVLGATVGALYAVGLRPVRRAYADNLMTAASLGLPLWGLLSVVAIPVLAGRMPQWGAREMRSHFHELVGWVLFGALLGVINQALSDVVAA